MTAARSGAATAARTRPERRSASRSTASPRRTARSRCGTGTRCNRSGWLPTAWCSSSRTSSEAERRGAWGVVPVDASRGRGAHRREPLPTSHVSLMRFDDFRLLVERLLREVPPAYLDGVVVVEVSPKAVPHPVRGDVYTLGECIPLEWSGNGADLQSRVVLYHGSFAALARLGDFDWREEAWETLSHELRHHLEWRANSSALEAYDWAAEQNFARQEGHPFDPVFYRSGEKIADGVYKVEDDVFIESWTAGKGEREGL